MAALKRDVAIARARRTRLWMIAGAAALTAAITWLVSEQTFGATHKQPASKASAATRLVEPQMPPLASPSVLGLQGPARAPQPAPASTPPAQAPPAAPPAPVPGGS